MKPSPAHMQYFPNVAMTNQRQYNAQSYPLSWEFRPGRTPHHVQSYVYFVTEFTAEFVYKSYPFDTCGPPSVYTQCPCTQPKRQNQVVKKKPPPYV